MSERILDPKVADYLSSLYPDPDEVLAGMEAQADREGIPILDRDPARFLAILVRAIGARRILEVGTAIGFSGIHMARALPEGGLLVTIELSQKRVAEAREYFRRAGVLDRVRFETGPALEVLPRLRAHAEPPFDLVFLDAIKDEYERYLDLCLPMLRRGGVVAADNVLWSGEVAGHPTLPRHDPETAESLRAFNRRLVTHPDLDAMVLPLGDGIALAVKR